MSTATAAHIRSIFLNVLHAVPNGALVSAYSLYILHHPAYVHVAHLAFSNIRRETSWSDSSSLDIEPQFNIHQSH